MPELEGFFDLEAPADLLMKLRHDYSRIVANPIDSYAAFDFLVTAEHLLDWTLPGKANTAQRTAQRNNSPLLRVTSHLANGAKHFKLEDPRHAAVSHEIAHQGVFHPAVFDPHVFDTPALVVVLQGDDAAKLGSEIRVLDLALQVLEYWELKLAAGRDSAG